MTPTLKLDLGSYLREQRRAAKLSLRQLSELAGISNPYLSQIERGLKKPSAETVSYTHLDVYKRQGVQQAASAHLMLRVQD